jgi:hypothetical protein
MPVPESATAIRTPDGIASDLICNTRPQSVTELIAFNGIQDQIPEDQLQLDSMA